MNLAPSKITVNLAALTENYNLFKGMSRARVAGVIKANAYGTGAGQAYTALLAAGCRDFFVATPDEALALPAASADARTYILGGVYDGAEGDYDARGLVPVLNSMGQVARWKAQAAKAGRKLPAILHLDTGMNRLGLERRDVTAIQNDPSLIEGIDLQAVMTHFACSDEKDHPLNLLQAQRFAQMADAFPNIPRSLCNSFGIFRNEGWHHDLLRPGYALYGGNPVPERSNPMRRVVDLSVRILQIRLGIKGESAGYGASYVLERDTPLAVVSFGYADGLPRAGSSRAKLYWKGRPCVIAGRISMDLVIVDLSPLEGDLPREGDWLEVLGAHQGVDTLADDCGTIGYEILTALSRRATRVYEG